jgi:hypothetical protein
MNILLFVFIQKAVSLEVNMLQFFYAYVQHTSGSQLLDSCNDITKRLLKVMLNTITLILF